MDGSLAAKLESMYTPAALSSLSGAVQEVEKEADDLLTCRIAHLSAESQEAIRSLSKLQHGYPVRAYESDDGLRAGVICGASLREDKPEILRLFSRLFFGPHHSDICVVFREELRGVGRKYRK